MAEVKLYNDKGVQKTREELFNSAELARIDHNQELMNDAGYGDIDLTLLVVFSRISHYQFGT